MWRKAGASGATARQGRRYVRSGSHETGFLSHGGEGALTRLVPDALLRCALLQIVSFSDAKVLDEVKKILLSQPGECREAGARQEGG